MSIEDEARASLIHMLFDQAPDDWDENDIGILADAIEEWQASRKPEAAPSDTDRDKFARAYDPEAFEDHPAEARSTIAAIQWAARRKLATDAAERMVPWLAQRDALERTSQPVQIEVTDDMVEKAAIALDPAPWRSEHPASRARRDDIRIQARAALSAALGGGKS